MKTNYNPGVEEKIQLFEDKNRHELYRLISEINKEKKGKKEVKKG